MKLKNLLKGYSALKLHESFYRQLFIAIFLFAGSLFLNYAANSYTFRHSGGIVNDILLDLLPVVEVGSIYYEGVLVLIAFICFLALYKPSRIPFLLKSMALFIATRSFFIILTHLSPPLEVAIVPTGNFMEKLIAGSGKDLFFSGHTGLPFLMALMFWHNKSLRYIFLAVSLVFGSAVLLGHLHYSIDVFSAFFIGYGVFHLSTILFNKDYKYFKATV